MKGDMRVSMPLWQMGSIVILMVLVLMIGLSSTFTAFDDGGFEFELQLQNGPAIVFGVFLIVFFLYMAIFYGFVAKHNKLFPEQKINILSIKPPEYMDDDELFEEMTKRATKKVYTYFVWALPILAGFYIGAPIGRTWMVLGILLLALGQYWIYYSTMRKFLKGEEE